MREAPPRAPLHRFSGAPPPVFFRAGGWRISRGRRRFSSRDAVSRDSPLSTKAGVSSATTWVTEPRRRTHFNTSFLVGPMKIVGKYADPSARPRRTKTQAAFQHSRRSISRWGTWAFASSFHGRIAGMLICKRRWPEASRLRCKARIVLRFQTPTEPHIRSRRRCAFTTLIMRSRWLPNANRIIETASAASRTARVRASVLVAPTESPPIPHEDEEVICLTATWVSRRTEETSSFRRDRRPSITAIVERVGAISDGEQAR